MQPPRVISGDNVDIGQAITAIKAGKKVKRAEWCGYWFLCRPIVYLPEPFIIAHCKDGTNRPASAYQEDILADDWSIVE